MAVFDPTKFEYIRNIFPELSETQCLVALLYSVGFSVKEIASQRKVSPSTVNNILFCVREKFDQTNIRGIRCIVLLRLMLRGIF